MSRYDFASVNCQPSTTMSDMTVVVWAGVRLRVTATSRARLRHVFRSPSVVIGHRAITSTNQNRLAKERRPKGGKCDSSRRACAAVNCGSNRAVNKRNLCMKSTTETHRSCRRIEADSVYCQRFLPLAPEVNRSCERRAQRYLLVRRASSKRASWPRAY